MVHIDYNVEGVMDIVLPSSSSTKPWVIMIHGGGWHFQTKSAMEGLACVFANRGYPVVNVSYPLLSFTFDQVLLLLSVLTLLVILCWAWLRYDVQLLTGLWLMIMMIIGEIWRHKPWLTIEDQLSMILKQVEYIHTRYELSSDCPWIVAGYSSGAHLSSLISMRGLPSGLGYIHTSVLISGIYGKDLFLEMPASYELYKATFQDVKGEFALEYSQPNDDRTCILLINGESDLNLKKHSYYFYHHLYDAGIYVKSIMIPDTTHWSVHREWSHSRSWVMDQVEEFIERL